MTRILVIDDKLPNREMLVDYLGLMLGEGYEIVAVENGVEGLKVLDESVVACLCDVIMPKMNGLEFLKKSKEKYPNIPVFMMTGNLMHIRQEDLEKNGSECIFQKPFDIKLIVERIKEATG